MATRKKLVSTICILSLILAITAGVLLSVGSQSSNDGYVGGNFNFDYTGVTVNAGAMTSEASADAPADAPSDAVQIYNQSSLESFLNSGASYGYLTASFDLNWGGTGTNKALDAGRTINGNGWTVTLKDDNGTANQYKDTFGGNPSASKGGAYTGGMDYGMFVAYNAGTIKNIKFKYDQALTVSNDSGNIIPNYAGLVCGTNVGLIKDCDLDANGSFRYEYQSGSLHIDDKFPEGNNLVRMGFTVSFGGIAGRNAGTITNITTKYSGTTSVDNVQCFDISLNVTAANKDASGVIKWAQRANANAFCGGIAGRMSTNASEISNIIQTGHVAMYMKTKYNQNTGTDERAHQYAIAASVVGANSAYSVAEDIGEGAENQGKIDNIIQCLDVHYSGQLGISSGNNDCTWPSEFSPNAVVYCGEATNVTILDKTNKVVSNQNVDYQVDHCNCGVGGNEGNHRTGYGNIITPDNHSDVAIAMVKDVDSDGNEITNQSITVTPNTTDKYILGAVKFTKHNGRNEDAEGTRLQSSKGEDTGTYGGTPKNDTIYLYTDEVARVNQYTLAISPYQATGAKYWELEVHDYAIADISSAQGYAEGWSTEYTYNGFDFLTKQLKYTTKDGAQGLVVPSGMNAVTSDEYENPVTSGRLPGEYSFVLQEKEAGFSYVNKEQRVVVFNESTANLAPFAFKVNKANMQIKDYPLTWFEGERNWISEVTDFEFELIGAIDENAFNGYVYEVNGSLYTRNGQKTLTNDTSTVGRTYTVYLISGGTQVTESITYTVKIDLDAPTLKIPQYEHPDGRYYTHNRVAINASDAHSGVETILMYNYDAQGNQIGDPVDVIAECLDNSGENDLSFIDEETGNYVWYFTNSGTIVIEVTDIAGQKTRRELNVNIDNFIPTISVDAYFYENYTDGEGNVQTKKSTYTNNKEVYSAVYFNATAQFGESGGVIQYSYDNVTWETYTETLVVKVSGDIYLRAMSNTFDHTDTYPYKKMYQVNTFWSNNLKEENGVQVVIPFKVNVEVEHVTITLDDITVSNTTKVFDGTTYFNTANIVAKSTFAAQINGDIIFTAEYADVNAADEVAIKITARCTDNTKVLDNAIDDVIGKIEKREISVVIDNKEKYYGYALPELTYKASNMVAGFIEDVELYVDKGEYQDFTYELLPQSKRDNTNDGYVITVVEGFTFTNYTLPAANITTGMLQIDLAPIDRLVYNKGQFTGLDTNNIATRNLEIGFKRVTGVYEKLNVKFERRVYDDTSGSLVTRWVVQKDMKTAQAGFYRVTITLPELSSDNQPLHNMYELDSTITTFMIKVIDASRFIGDEEEPDANNLSAATTDKTEQTAPVVNNNAQPSDYEGGKTTTDNTNTEINPATKNTRDYLTIVSIFCAVALMIAFAFGVGRAVAKRLAQR